MFDKKNQLKTPAISLTAAAATTTTVRSAKRLDWSSTVAARKEHNQQKQQIVARRPVEMNERAQVFSQHKSLSKLETCLVAVKRKKGGKQASKQPRSFFHG